MERESGKGDQPYLSDTIDLTEEQLQKFIPLWQAWKLDGGKHTVRELLLEPEEPWEAVMIIETRYQDVLESLRSNNANRNSDS